jgi:hypothetical protein
LRPDWHRIEERLIGLQASTIRAYAAFAEFEVLATKLVEATDALEE